MIDMKKYFFKIIAIAILLSGIMFAQQKSYSLQSLIKMAVKNNSDLLISSGNLSISEKEKTKAVSGLLPEINAEGGYIHSSEKNQVPLFVGANGKNEILALLSLRQTIFDPDAIYNFKASSIKRKEGAILHELTKQDVIGQVIEQYFTVLKYNNEIEIFSENLKSFQLMYEQSRLLFDSGTVPEIDVKKSKVELLLQRNALNKAKINYSAALGKLKELIGVNLTEKLNIEQFDITKVVLNSVIAYQNAAWQNRPDWKLAEVESELSSANISRAFSSRFPTVNANLFYGWDALNKLDKQNLGFQAVISASIPLWHWGAVSAENQIAEIKHQQNDYKTRRLKLRILQEIENNYNEAKLQKEQIAAMKESVTEAKLAIDMAMTGYKEGIITNLDLINTQKLYTQTEMEYYKAFYNFYLAKVNLFKSIGKLKGDLSWIEE